jgi:hemimethylated DNA binding protein
MSKNPIAPDIAEAMFTIGDVVRHRIFEFRGVVFDIDPVFANSEEWYDSIPAEVRPAKDQPFYHLFAENGDNSYIAYVSRPRRSPSGWRLFWQMERVTVRNETRDAALKPNPKTRRFGALSLQTHTICPGVFVYLCIIKSCLQLAPIPHFAVMMIHGSS